jgi:hypothetical protein
MNVLSLSLEIRTVTSNNNMFGVISGITIHISLSLEIRTVTSNNNMFGVISGITIHLSLSLEILIPDIIPNMLLLDVTVRISKDKDR